MSTVEALLVGFLPERGPKLEDILNLQSELRRCSGWEAGFGAGLAFKRRHRCLKASTVGAFLRNPFWEIRCFRTQYSEAHKDSVIDCYRDVK